MKIVADEDIPLVRESFGNLGEVKTCRGREITRSVVKDADVLLVRSVTHVEESLLSGSKVRFVGTATIGCDHVDTAYLKKNGIGFASAPGSNANSVAEYIVAAILVLSTRYGFCLSEKTIGVVGVGNVGSLVVEKANVLGMKVLQNDPPLRRKTKEKRFRPLDELLESSDMLTLHVPLTYDGVDATCHLGDEALFQKMKSGSFLINTSRGKVVDNKGLLGALNTGTPGGAVIDVWEGEPQINEELLRKVEIGTPHIAGYSLDGKCNAILLIYKALCQFLNMPCELKLPELPLPPNPVIELNTERDTDDEILAEAVGKAYCIERDDSALREILKAPSQKKRFFDRLRQEYPLRREFRSIKVKLRGGNRSVVGKLKALGFTVTK